MTRVIIIVFDSVGIGELPDADHYGDVGSNTLGNIARSVGGLSLPNLQQLGLGNIAQLEGIPPVDHPKASYGKMAERSAGKDTTTGHWELMGLTLEHPFPTYPNGFRPGLKLLKNLDSSTWIPENRLCIRPPIASFKSLPMKR